jgi:hypothetical protein
VPSTGRRASRQHTAGTWRASYLSTFTPAYLRHAKGFVFPPYNADKASATGLARRDG